MNLRTGRRTLRRGLPKEGLVEHGNFASRSVGDGPLLGTMRITRILLCLAALAGQTTGVTRQPPAYAALNLRRRHAPDPMRLRGGELQRTQSAEVAIEEAGRDLLANCKVVRRPGALADLKMGDVIGFGSFSTVHAALNAYGDHLAIKKIRLQEDDAVMVKRMQREIQILGSMNHRNIVKLVDVFSDDSVNESVNSTVSIAMERCMGGELFDFVNDFQTFLGNGERSWRRTGTNQTLIVTEGHIAKMVQQILLAVNYLHDKGVVHRDLKLENVMLSEAFAVEKDPEIKLIDFGFSRDDEGRRDMFSACGSTLYIAPEVLTAKEKKSGYGRECDLWAVGVMTYILLCCTPPFMGPTSYDIGCAIKSGKYRYPEYAIVSDEAKNLIRHLLELNPAKRYTVKEALQDPWILRHAGPPPPEVIFPSIAAEQATQKRKGALLGFQLPELLSGKWLRHMVPQWHNQIHEKTPLGAIDVATVR